MNRQAVQTLKTYFGYDTFREGQESVVESILEHRDVLAIMPTAATQFVIFFSVYNVEEERPFFLFPFTHSWHKSVPFKKTN